MKGVFLAILQSSTLLSLVISQPQCELTLPNSTELSGIIEKLLQLSQEESVHTLESAIQYTCLAQGETQGMYRAASVIVTYYRENSLLVQAGQIQIICLDNSWMPIVDEGINKPPVGYASLEVNHSCSNCSHAGNNTHNCISKCKC